MQGLHPPNVRYIKPYRYTVQHGDDVGTITGHFGMPVHKWPELCGANCHKRMTMDAPTGFKHRCFEGLSAGEQLCIPSYWKEPKTFGSMGSPLTRPFGSVGLTPLDLLGAFQSAVKGALGTILPPAQQPPPSLLDSILAVIYSWWKHLGKGNTPTIPVPPPLPTTPQEVLNQLGNGVMTADNWGLLFKSANDFLTATGIGQGNGTLPQVQNIPWSDIPWTQMANVWQAVPPQVWAQISSVMQGKSGGTPHTTQPTFIRPPLPPSGLPNFLDPTTWTQSQSFAGVPFKSLTWSDMLTEATKDPRFAQCALNSPNGVKDLQTCPHCWDSATTFVDRLCDAKPCDCKTDTGGDPDGGTPTTPPTVKKTEKKGLDSMVTAAIVISAALGILIVVDTAGGD